MKTFKITITKSPKGDYYSTVRKVVNGAVFSVPKTKTLLGHVESLKDKIFRELVASRETLKLKES